MTEEENEPVGSVGEEALKLLAALQGWAQESGADYADVAAGVAAGAASVMHEVNEHIATGAEECRYCPVCRVVSAARDVSPEVKQHLSTAATSLVQAMAAAMETRVPRPEEEARPEPGVEKIDLSDEGDWEEDQWD